MKIEINISNQDISDVLTTAIEGGSNYWYYLPDLSMVAHPASKNSENKYLSDRIIEAVLENNAIIPVNDAENEDDKLGEISKENFERGIKLFLESGRNFDPAMDAEDADVFFQYVVLGEVVFG